MSSVQDKRKEQQQKDLKEAAKQYAKFKASEVSGQGKSKSEYESDKKKAYQSGLEASGFTEDTAGNIVSSRLHQEQRRAEAEARVLENINQKLASGQPSSVVNIGGAMVPRSAIPKETAEKYDHLNQAQQEQPISQDAAPVVTGVHQAQKEFQDFIGSFDAQGIDVVSADNKLLKRFPVDTSYEEIIKFTEEHPGEEKLFPFNTKEQREFVKDLVGSAQNTNATTIQVYEDKKLLTKIPITSSYAILPELLASYNRQGKDVSFSFVPKIKLEKGQDIPADFIGPGRPQTAFVAGGVGSPIPFTGESQRKPKEVAPIEKSVLEKLNETRPVFKLGPLEIKQDNPVIQQGKQFFKGVESSLKSAAEGTYTIATAPKPIFVYDEQKQIKEPFEKALQAYPEELKPKTETPLTKSLREGKPTLTEEGLAHDIGAIYTDVTLAGPGAKQVTPLRYKPIGFGEEFPVYKGLVAGYGGPKSKFLVGTIDGKLVFGTPKPEAFIPSLRKAAEAGKTIEIGTGSGIEQQVLTSEKALKAFRESGLFTERTETGVKLGQSIAKTSEKIPESHVFQEEFGTQTIKKLTEAENIAERKFLAEQQKKLFKPLGRIHGSYSEVPQTPKDYALSPADVEARTVLGHGEQIAKENAAYLNRLNIDPNRLFTAQGFQTYVQEGHIVGFRGFKGKPYSPKFDPQVLFRQGKPKSIISGEQGELEFHHITKGKQGQGIILTKEEHAGITALQGQLGKIPKIKGQEEILRLFGERKTITPDYVKELESFLAQPEKRAVAADVLKQAAAPFKELGGSKQKIAEFPHHGMMKPQEVVESFSPTSSSERVYNVALPKGSIKVPIAPGAKEKLVLAPQRFQTLRRTAVAFSLKGRIDPKTGQPYFDIGPGDRPKEIPKLFARLKAEEEIGLKTGHDEAGKLQGQHAEELKKFFKDFDIDKYLRENKLEFGDSYIEPPTPVSQSLILTGKKTAPSLITSSKPSSPTIKEDSYEIPSSTSKYLDSLYTSKSYSPLSKSSISSISKFPPLPKESYSLLPYKTSKSTSPSFTESKPSSPSKSSGSSFYPSTPYSPPSSPPSKPPYYPPGSPSPSPSSSPPSYPPGYPPYVPPEVPPQYPRPGFAPPALLRSFASDLRKAKPLFITTFESTDIGVKYIHGQPVYKVGKTPKVWDYYNKANEKIIDKFYGVKRKTSKKRKKKS